MTALLDDPARAAVVEAAASRLEPGMTLGLGSGRAVWALLEVLATRWAAGQSGSRLPPRPPRHGPRQQDSRSFSWRAASPST